MNIGDEKEINVTFPEEYHAEELKGKPAMFKVKVNEIKEKVLPELDDDFAQDVSDFDTLAEYKDDLKKTIAERKANEAKAKKEDEAIAKIIESSKMDIPEAMVNTQVNRMLEDFAQRLQMQGLSVEQYFQYTGVTAEKIIEKQLREFSQDLFLKQLLRQKVLQLQKKNSRMSLTRWLSSTRWKSKKLKNLWVNTKKSRLRKISQSRRLLMLSLTQ